MRRTIYGCIEVNEGMERIMDFSEIELFSKNKEDQSCLVIERSSNKLDLVYGSYYPQPDQDTITAKEKIFLAKGSTLAYIEDGTCRLFELLDIKISDTEPREDDYIQIPFVALVKGLESEPTNIFCISAFLRFADMIIKDNILNRYGIYAIHSIGAQLKLKDTVIHEHEWLDNDTWTELIDWNLLTIIEPEDRDYYHHTDHTAIIEELKYTDNVQVEEISTFAITHMYSNESIKYYIKAPYVHEIFDALIAYIQLIIYDINEHYGTIHEQNIIKTLVTFYDCIPLETVDDAENAIPEIDLFINWESWVSELKDVIYFKQFYRTGLIEFLKGIILAER